MHLSGCIQPVDDQHDNHEEDFPYDEVSVISPSLIHHRRIEFRTLEAFSETTVRSFVIAPPNNRTGVSSRSNGWTTKRVDTGDEQSTEEEPSMTATSVESFTSNLTPRRSTTKQMPASNDDDRDEAFGRKKQVPKLGDLEEIFVSKEPALLRNLCKAMTCFTVDPDDELDSKQLCQLRGRPVRASSSPLPSPPSCSSPLSPPTSVQSSSPLSQHHSIPLALLGSHASPSTPPSSKMTQFRSLTSPPIMHRVTSEKNDRLLSKCFNQARGTNGCEMSRGLGTSDMVYAEPDPILRVGSSLFDDGSLADDEEERDQWNEVNGEEEVHYATEPVGSVAKLVVHRLGPKHLQVYRFSLPGSHLSILRSIRRSCNDHASTRQAGWTTHLYPLTEQDNQLTEVLVAALDRSSQPTLLFQEDCKMPESTTTRTKQQPRVQSWGSPSSPSSRPSFPCSARDLVRPVADFVLSAVKTLYGMPTADDDCTAVIILDQSRPHVLGHDVRHPSFPVHYDRCHVTANVVMGPSQYDGGGTYLDDLDECIMLKEGDVLVHPGPLIHAGCDTTIGPSYVVVCFCELGK